MNEKRVKSEKRKGRREIAKILSQNDAKKKMVITKQKKRIQRRPGQGNEDSNMVDLRQSKASYMLQEFLKNLES